MCIAIIKNKNIELPSEDILRICFNNNPDGAGFVLNRNGVNYIYKGYFTFDGFLKALKLVSPLKEESLMIHFRVATHGKINIENCHPFPIDGYFKNMLKPIYATNSDVMIHNGKLLIDITNPIYSDSMHFAKSLYQFDRKNNSEFLEYIIQPTDKNKRGNRIGILTSNGETEHYGVGWIEQNGILYSNDSFKTNGTYKSSFKKKIKTTRVGFSVFNDLNVCDKCSRVVNQIYTCHIANKNGNIVTQRLCNSCKDNINNLFSCDDCREYYNLNELKIKCGKRLCKYCLNEETFGISLYHGKNCIC